MSVSALLYFVGGYMTSSFLQYRADAHARLAAKDEDWIPVTPARPKLKINASDLKNCTLKPVYKRELSDIDNSFMGELRRRVQERRKFVYHDMNE